MKYLAANVRESNLYSDCVGVNIQANLPPGNPESDLTKYRLVPIIGTVTERDRIPHAAILQRSWDTNKGWVTTIIALYMNISTAKKDLAQLQAIYTKNEESVWEFNRNSHWLVELILTTSIFIH